jgi:hypothetical protein
MPRFGVVLGMLVACGSNVLADLEVVRPSEKQTLLLRGSAEVSRGVRTVTGSVDATGHGPITYYTVPFRKGMFSLSWKASDEERLVFVFDSKPNGKATHALKVYVNGAPGKGKDERDVLALVTYDGSVHADKKASIVKHDHYSACNQWHEMSVTFGGDKAIVSIDDKSYAVSSERFLEPIEKCGVGHFSGSLQTRDVKIQKHDEL